MCIVPSQQIRNGNLNIMMTPNVPYVLANHQYEQVGFKPPTGLKMALASDLEKQFFLGCDQLSKHAFQKAEMTFTQMAHRYTDFLDSRFILAALKIRKGEWQQAQYILLPLTGRSYFISYWIFRFLPDFRFLLHVNPVFWLPILPRSEEIAIAMAHIRQQQGDHDTALAIARKALEKYPSNLSVRVYLASLLFERENYDETIKLLNMNLKRRGDDAATIFRFLRGLAMMRFNDLRTGFFQMESSLDFAFNTSPYLKENIRFRMIEELIANRLYVDAITYLNELKPSVATVLPTDFNHLRVRNELIKKVKTVKKRGMNIKMSLHGYKKPGKEEEDFWEVDPNR